MGDILLVIRECTYHSQSQILIAPFHFGEMSCGFRLWGILKRAGDWPGPFRGNRTMLAYPTADSRAPSPVPSRHRLYGDAHAIGLPRFDMRRPSIAVTDLFGRPR